MGGSVASTCACVAVPAGATHAFLPKTEPRRNADRTRRTMPAHRPSREAARTRRPCRGRRARSRRRPFRRGELRRHVARRATRERHGGVRRGGVEEERERLASDGDGREVGIERAAGERDREQGPGVGGARTGSVAAIRRGVMARARNVVTRRASDERGDRDEMDPVASNPHASQGRARSLATQATQLRGAWRREVTRGLTRRPSHRGRGHPIGLPQHNRHVVAHGLPSRPAHRDAREERQRDADAAKADGRTDATPLRASCKGTKRLQFLEVGLDAKAAVGHAVFDPRERRLFRESAAHHRVCARRAPDYRRRLTVGKGGPLLSRGAILSPYQPSRERVPR